MYRRVDARGCLPFLLRDDELNEDEPKKRPALVPLFNNGRNVN